MKMKSVWQTIKKIVFQRRFKDTNSDANHIDDEIIETWDLCGEEMGQVLGTLWPHSSCTKDPQHLRFTPVHSFCLDNLPPDVRHAALLNYVKCHEKLVVKIHVSKLSESRPRKSSKSKFPSSFATGYAWCAIERTELSCSLDACRESGESSGHAATFGGILIYTNKHVVFDDYEASHTEVAFSFDDNRVAAYGIKLRENRQNKDLVSLEVFTHNPDLYHTVGKYTEDVANAWNDIPASIKNTFKKYAVVISHPHGLDKVISVGNLIMLEKEEDVEIRSEEEEEDSVSNTNLRRKPTRKVTSYSAATCQGSSGAPVLTGFYQGKPFTHSRTSARLKNYCLSY